MLDNELKSYLLPNLFNAAVRAGAAIMQVYKNKEDYDISICLLYTSDAADEL